MDKKALHETEQDRHRQGGDHAGRHHLMPVDHILADKIGQGEAGRPQLGVGDEDQGNQQLIPGEDEGIDGGHRHPWSRQGEDDPQDPRHPGTPVHISGLFQSEGHIAQIALQQPDRHRSGQGAVGDDDPGKGVEQLQGLNNLVQPHDQDDGGKHLGHQHQKQKRPPPDKGESGQGIGGGKGQHHRDQRCRRRNKQAVEKGGGKLVGPEPHLNVIGPLGWVRNPGWRPRKDASKGFQGSGNHHRHRKQQYGEYAEQQNMNP